MLLLLWVRARSIFALLMCNSRTTCTIDRPLPHKVLICTNNIKCAVLHLQGQSRMLQHVMPFHILELTFIRATAASLMPSIGRYGGLGVLPYITYICRDDTPMLNHLILWQFNGGNKANFVRLMVNVTDLGPIFLMKNSGTYSLRKDFRKIKQTTRKTSQQCFTIFRNLYIYVT